MPQLDKFIFITQIFWLFLFFFISYFFLIKFSLPYFVQVLKFRKFKHVSLFVKNSELKSVLPKKDLVFNKSVFNFVTLSLNLLDDIFTKVKYLDVISNLYLRKIDVLKNIIVLFGRKHFILFEKELLNLYSFLKFFDFNVTLSEKFVNVYIYRLVLEIKEFIGLTFNMILYFLNVCWFSSFVLMQKYNSFIYNKYLVFGTFNFFNFKNMFKKFFACSDSFLKKKNGFGNLVNFVGSVGFFLYVYFKFFNFLFLKIWSFSFFLVGKPIQKFEMSKFLLKIYGVK